MNGHVILALYQLGLRDINRVIETCDLPCSQNQAAVIENSSRVSRALWCKEI